MTDRFTPFRPESLDPRQRAVYDAIASGPRGTVPWIFHLFLESPDLADRVQALGAFCRYGTGLPPRLSELAILTVARHWDAEYEWSVHEREALAAGVPEDVIAAIRDRATPSFEDKEMGLVHEFAAALLQRNDVPDALFARAEEHFGRRTVVELTALLGYYSMLAMTIRTFRLPPQK